MRLQSLPQAGDTEELSFGIRTLDFGDLDLNPVNPRNPATPPHSTPPADHERGIRLRPVEPASDDALLLELYASTRAHEMSLVPWSAEQKAAFLHMQFEAQKAHYAAQYPNANHDIICQYEVPVGRLYLDRGAEVLHVLDITILPAKRKAGIGSYILGELLREAGEAGKSVTIHVESYNPSLQFFEKLGFHKAAEAGMHFLMEWKA